MASPFYANSRGQDLAEHSVLVGRLAAHIILSSYIARHDDNADESMIRVLASLARSSGHTHDIGKVDPEFRDWVTAILAAKEAIDPDGKDGEQIEGKEGFSFEEYPRHEEVSWVLLRCLMDVAAVRKLVLGGDQVGAAQADHSRYGMLEHAVYWHHARPLRKGTIQEDSFSDAQKICARLADKSDWLESRALEDLRALFARIDELEGTQLGAALVPDMASAQFSAHPVPGFKKLYEDVALLSGPKAGEAFAGAVRTEAYRTAIRSALVTSDRTVSALSKEALSQHVAAHTLPQWQEPPQGISGLYDQISAMVERFAQTFPGARTQQQIDAAHKLARASGRAGIACLQGPAGCGKSKIALHYLELLSKLSVASCAGVLRKVFVFVPRTAIGEALFNELVQDYGITDRVELLTGNVKLMCRAGGTPVETPEDEVGTGNLVITTVDRLCATVLSHRHIDLVTEIAHSHVIFDEFHELFDIPGISLLFHEVMQLRRISRGCTLLVSATPTRYLLDKLDIEADSVVSVPTFNDKPIHLALQQWDPGVYALGTRRLPHPFVSGVVDIEDGAFVVCNTATTAQMGSLAHKLRGRTVICFHSKYTPRDKSELLQRIIATFGVRGQPQEELLISGPIVQASLNISTRHLHTEGCTAENLLQRLGRSNRFARLDESFTTVYWAPTRDGLANGQELRQMNQCARTTAFYRFLQEKFGPLHSMTTTLAQIYQWYDEFSRSRAAAQAYESDFLAILAESARTFKANDFDPVQIPPFMLKRATRKNARLAKHSLRGRSYFILPAKVSIAAPGARANVSLLWDASSDRADLMTDDLRHAEFSTVVEGRYFSWTRDAGKTGTFSRVKAGGPGGDFLRDISKKVKPYKRWQQLRLQALHRDTPVLVSCDTFDENAMVYLQLADLKVGLTRCGHVNDRVRHPGFNLSAAF